MTFIWRGPFKVKRDGRRWKIVNAAGDTERQGYVYKGAANEECRLMNLAMPYCDERVDDR